MAQVAPDLGQPRWCTRPGLLYALSARVLQGIRVCMFNGLEELSVLEPDGVKESQKDLLFYPVIPTGRQRQKSEQQHQ